jgi:hypothetical protein
MQEQVRGDFVMKRDIVRAAILEHGRRRKVSDFEDEEIACVRRVVNEEPRLRERLQPLPDAAGRRAENPEQVGERGLPLRRTLPECADGEEKETGIASYAAHNDKESLEVCRDRLNPFGGRRIGSEHADAEAYIILHG